MQDKSIRLGVDDSQLKNVGRTAKSIVDEMIRSSRQYSTSSKEVLRDIEEQIKAIERKNKLTLDGKRAEIDAEKRRMSMQKDAMMYEARAISDPTKRKAAITEVTSSYQLGKQGITSQEYSLRQEVEERKKQTQELRNIIDEIKATSRNEIKENREGVEKTIRSDKTLNQLGLDKKADTEQSLKRTIQRGEIGDVKKSEVTERSNFRGAGGVFNTGAGLATSKNDLYALAGIVGLTPAIGQGLSSLTQRLLSAGETAERSMTGYSYSTFGNYSKSGEEWANAKALGLTSIGLDPSEVLSRKADITRTTGRGISDDKLTQLLGAEQFVGAGTINQIAGINRYGGGNMTSVLQILEGNQRNMARLTENISAYVSTSNRSLQIGSNINESQMAKTIMGISAATGQSGIGLQQTSSAIQGLGQTRNPLVRSLMMRAFRQSNPNASLFDIQAMIEDPLANFEKGGGQFFKNIKEMTGGGDMYKQVLYAIFGGQLSRTRINEIIDSGGDFTKILSKSKRSGGNIDFLEESKSGAGKSTEMTALTDTTFQEYGIKAIDIGDKIIENLKIALDKIFEEQTKKEETGLEQLKKVFWDAFNTPKSVIYGLLDKIVKNTDSNK